MKAPSVDYAAVAPMLIVFGVALASVLVEAFVARTQRFIVQVVLTTVGVAAALIDVVYLGTQSTSLTTAGGTVVIDGPALFLQGTILVLGLLAVLTMADEASPDSSAFTAQASTTPGSPEEAGATRLGLVQTEVYPLLLLSLVGMLLFPASNDLLTMFVALEVFSLPLYLLCGLARRRRRARPQSRYSGREKTSRAMNMVSRSLDAGNSSIPPSDNSSSGYTSVCTRPSREALASSGEPGVVEACAVNAVESGLVSSAMVNTASKAKTRIVPCRNSAGPSITTAPLAVTTDLSLVPR